MVRAVGGGAEFKGIETEGCCREAAQGANMLSPSAGVGLATRLWDALGLRLMCVEAAFGVGCGPAVGRRCVRGAAARVVYGGGHLDGFRCCVGLAGAVEELLEVPASPPLAES